MIAPDELALLHGWLDETLAADEVPRLESLLRENAEARALLRSLSTVDERLREMAAARPATLEILGLAVAFRPSAAKPRWRAPLAWAAVAAVLASAGFFFLQPKIARVRLAAVTGEVRVWRAQDTMTAKTGFVLQEGDWLLTAKDGAAEVEFPGETTRLKIGAEAEFGVVTAFPDKQLKLTAGKLHASVARQSASHPMLIRTPTAKAEVLGTKFEMSATKERTEMSVTEGRVLIARTDDESGVVVEASQSATVRATEPVDVRTPPVAELLGTGLLARWSFDESGADSSGHGHDLKISGEVAWGAGHSGGALDLHAAKVEAESPPIALPDIFTVALWLRIQPGAARPQPVLAGDGRAMGMNDFSIILPPTFPGSGVILEVSGRTMGSQAYARPGAILAGRWQHLAVIVNSGEGSARFFVDGREVTGASGLRHDFKLGGSLLLGRRTKVGPQPFDGQLDDFRIYDRALTATEISALAQ